MNGTPNGILGFEASKKWKCDHGVPLAVPCVECEEAWGKLRPIQPRADSWRELVEGAVPPLFKLLLVGAALLLFVHLLFTVR